MKILMTSDCVGGVWSYATTLCRALAAHDVAVTLAVTGGAMSASQRSEAADLGNVELHHRPYKCEWMREPLADVAAAGKWLERLADESAADVVHLNDFAHGGRDFGGRPRVVVAHSDVRSWHRHVLNAAPDAGEWGAYERAVRAGLSGASAVVAPTRAVLADLGQFGVGAPRPLKRATPSGASTRVETGRFRNQRYRADRGGLAIPNAAGSAAWEPGAAREPFVLCAGRVWDAAKNVRALAAAAAGLPWPVRVAGDASHPDGGVASFDNVEVLGPLPHDALLSLKNRAAVYALPAKYEPFGLSAVEAGLRGCALVLGDIPSLREVWGDAAVFVPPDDADLLRATLLRLIDDERERRRLAVAARERASRYTPEVQARRYVELYRQVLAG